MTPDLAKCSRTSNPLEDKEEEENWKNLNDRLPRRIQLRDGDRKTWREGKIFLRNREGKNCCWGGEEKLRNSRWESHKFLPSACVPQSLRSVLRQFFFPILLSHSFSTRPLPSLSQLTKPTLLSQQTLSLVFSRVGERVCINVLTQSFDLFFFPQTVFFWNLRLLFCFYHPRRRTTLSLHEVLGAASRKSKEEKEKKKKQAMKKIHFLILS